MTSPVDAYADALVRLLIDAWTAALETPVDADSDFIALGGTSMAAVAIGAAVAERHPDCEGIELRALEALFECTSLRAMAELLAAHIGEHRAPAA